MKRCLILLLLLVLAGIVSNAGTLPVSGQDRQETISVTGRGEVTAIPDLAAVNFEVVQENADLSQAVAAERSVMKQVVTALGNDGIAGKDIQTVAYRITPKTKWDHGTSTTIGYVVANQIRVTLRNLKQAGQILSDAVCAGANQANGLEFIVENKEKYIALALKKAVEDAKMKAQVIAEATGANVGHPIYLNEIESFSPPPRPLYMARNSDAPEPVSPGEETITAGVNATFVLVNK